MAGPHKILRIVTRGTALSTGETRVKTIYNVWDFITAAIVGSPSKSGINTAFKSTIWTPLMACLSVNHIANAIDIRYLDDYQDPFQTFTNAVNGGVTGDSLPSVNNATMRLGSGVRGRNWQGRKHFGPLAESSTTLDYLNAGAITLFGTFQTAYLAGFSDASGTLWKPIVVSATLSYLDVSPPVVAYAPVTTTTVNAYLGIMRKRSQERTNTM